jgi:hypothetical protein
MVGHPATDVVAGCVGPAEVKSDRKNENLKQKVWRLKDASIKWVENPFLGCSYPVPITPKRSAF